MYSLDINSSPINNLNIVICDKTVSVLNSLYIWKQKWVKGQLNYCPVRHVFYHLFHLAGYKIIEFVWNSVVINFGIAQDHSINKIFVQNLKLWR